MPRLRSSRTRGSATQNPPITPMIDIMMCLLIVFMVVQPGLRRGLDLQMPGDALQNAAATGPDRIVLHVRPGPTYALNDEPVAAADLEARLRAVYAQRARKVLFVQGDTAATYADVIHAVDLSRGAGIEVIGLVPRSPRSDTSRTGGSPRAARKR